MSFRKNKQWILTGMLIFLFVEVKSNCSFNYNTNDSAQTAPKKYDSLLSHQEDIRDFIRKFVKIKNFLFEDSVKNKGLGPFLSILPSPGYAMVLGSNAIVTSNISFYTDSSKKRISNFQLSNLYSQYLQSLNVINSLIYIEKFKLSLIGDWEINKFPTNTYGLGNNTKITDADPLDFWQAKFYQFVSYEISSNIFTGFGYHFNYYWDIQEVNKSSNVITDFDRYGFTTHSCSSGPTLIFLYDSRANSINASQGLYCNIEYSPSFTFMGSNENWQSLLIDARKYFTFPQATNNVLAFWSYNVFTLSGKPPYLDLPSTGYDAYNNTGRGYVQGRYRGLSYMSFDAEYRFPLTKSGLLGAVVFVNSQSFTTETTKYFNQIIPGGGFGLRIKINKFSKVNAAIDYGFGVEGSRGFSLNLGEFF